MHLIDSPVGTLRLKTDETGAITTLDFVDKKPARPSPQNSDAIDQLKDYFAGKRTAFDVPVKLDGTEFQQQVWQALASIPFGETRSYGDIARQIGRPKAVRAVGLACGRNPVSIIIPCHRVIGSNGKLTGYGGGLDKKIWLLDFEKKLTPKTG